MRTAGMLWLMRMDSSTPPECAPHSPGTLCVTLQLCYEQARLVSITDSRPQVTRVHTWAFAPHVHARVPAHHDVALLHAAGWVPAIRGAVTPYELCTLSVLGVLQETRWWTSRSAASWRPLAPSGTWTWM